MRDPGAGEGSERIRFTSAILPRWARRTRSLDALLPTLYLRGVSTGDFQAALSARQYVYLWADGIHLQARREHQAECMLVLIGATPEGRRELVGFQVGVRESTLRLGLTQFSGRSVDLFGQVRHRAGLVVMEALFVVDGRSIAEA